jgi:uncharacterized protein
MVVELEEPGGGRGRAPRKAASMLCPVCDVALVMSERQQVEIDYCPQCRGVWLDRGELDKILDRSTAELKAQSAPAQPSHHQGHHSGHGSEHGSGPWTQGKPYKKSYGKYKKRRKSWLEEIFD